MDKCHNLNPLWNSNSQVSVSANVKVFASFLEASFAVKEPLKCFCQNKEKDGDSVWQDSCVEIFVKMLNNSGEYASFEFNSKGVCHSAFGKNRNCRVELFKNEYDLIERTPSEVLFEGGFARWNLSAKIPSALLGAKWDDLRSFPIIGNLYKCADLAQEKHYLSAFPINTPKPDFHTPEYFLPLC